MNLDTLLTYELSAVATESSGFTSRALFTEGLDFTVGFFHLRVEFLHAVDEESCWKLVGIVFGKEGFTPTLGAGEGLVGTCLLYTSDAADE